MSRKLDDLSDRFRPKAFEFLARLTEAGIQVLIVDTLRTPEEHAANLINGTSAAALSKHLDGKARGLPHRGSDALDVCPYEQYLLNGPDKLRWDTSDPVWQRIGTIAESLGLRWGGRWVRPHDPGHVEFKA
jgi:hypothetical protein